MLIDKPLEDEEQLLLEDKGLDDEPLKEEEPQSQEHKRLGDKTFEDKELLVFEDKDSRQAVQGRRTTASQSGEAR